MDQNPDRSLLIRKFPKFEILNEYLDGINFIDPAETADSEDAKYFKQTFPETNNAVAQRASSVGFKWAHKEVPTFYEPTATILVTHFCIEGNFICQEAPDIHEHPHKENIGYCALTAISVKHYDPFEKHKVELNGFNAWDLS